MPKLPRLWQNTVLLADWLELIALEADDKNASDGDLITTLTRLTSQERCQELALEVMSEIEQREQAVGEAYPFILENSRVLQAKDNWQECIAYVFCLCLSYFGWKPKRGAKVNPWYLFEELACVAAKQYFCGDVIRFGSRFNRATSSAFSGAIDDLCRRVGEGIGFRRQSTRNRQDDHVDLVAWKEFRDRKPSKLIIFGQCAAGDNWETKLSEMNPAAFCGQWMIEPPVSPLIRSFYIPFRIPRDDWQRIGRYTGVLFDRCRVAHWAYRANAEILGNHSYRQWAQSVLPAF